MGTFFHDCAVRLPEWNGMRDQGVWLILEERGREKEEEEKEKEKKKGGKGKESMETREVPWTEGGVKKRIWS